MQLTTARLADLLGPAPRLALVGLAKNTGKTETLAALLRELERAGTRVGVTSIGRDGEEHDVIDARIRKPRLQLPAGSLVATTGELLRASALAHRRVHKTGIRTPLGEVLIGELQEPGALVIAGPSAAEDLRSVAEAMSSLGAQRVLIDGAIDRRAASSPAVAGGLVMATGAVLDQDIERVVALTREAVELVRLDLYEERAAADGAGGPEGDGELVKLARSQLLGAEPTEIARLLTEHPRAHTLLAEGALSERFLEGLLGARRERAGRELRIVVADPTRVFLSRHGPGFYARQGLLIQARRGIDLRAVTVNPVAPESHRFDSAQLRELIGAVLEDVPVLDVLDPDYLALAS